MLTVAAIVVVAAIALAYPSAVPAFMLVVAIAGLTRQQGRPRLPPTRSNRSQRSAKLSLSFKLDFERRRSKQTPNLSRSPGATLALRGFIREDAPGIAVGPTRGASMTGGWHLHYDRRVEPEFLAHFKRGGVAHSLVEYAKNAPFPVDLQMRRSPKTGATHASLYVGLTDVLKISSKPQDKLTLTAHKTWTEGKFGFKSEWKQAQTPEELESSWREVEAYLEEVIPRAAEKHAAQEGMVQAAASAFSDGSRVMVDREAALHFRDQETKDRIMAEITEPIVTAVGRVGDVPGKRPERFGGECDLLAVDEDGRLLTVEVKPRRTGAIRWAAAQATVYAKLFERWVNADRGETPSAGEIVHGMLEQRQQLGLAKRISPYLSERPEVVPVVAVQRGAPDTYLEGFRKVQDALVAAGVGYPQLELYEVTIAGRLVELSPSED